MVIRVYVQRPGGTEGAVFARSLEKANELVAKWNKAGYAAYKQIIRK